MLRITCFLISLFLLGCQSNTPINKTMKNDNDQLVQLADDYLASHYKRYPVAATIKRYSDSSTNVSYDYDSALNRALPDESPDGIAMKQKQEDDFYKRLKTLNLQSKTNNPALFGLLKQTLESDIEERICKEELWDLDHRYGWHIPLERALKRAPVATNEDKSNVIQRYQQLSEFVDIKIANLKEGIKQGYIISDSVVQRMIIQLNKLLEENDTSPLYLL